MAIAGIGPLRRRARRLVAGLRSGIAVLMYHRVATPRFDPFAICVRPKHFADQVARLRERFPVLGMDELAAALATGPLPRRGVVLTFDDGYADLLSEVVPVLARHRVPATAFISVGSLGTPGFWWDDLARVVLGPPDEARSLRVRIGATPLAWRTGRGDTPALDVYYEIHARLRPLGETERRDALRQLGAGRATDAPTADDRPLTHAELRALGDGGWMTIGAHTMTHPLLSTLPPDLQRREMRESKNRLESLLGRSVDTLAYPHGDFGAETPALAAECGFRLAFTAAAGLVRRRADVHRLPRLAAPDADGAELCRRLEDWFAGRDGDR